MSAQGDNNDWVPVAAGLAIGVGVLALLYKLLSGGCRPPVKTCNQQMGIPFKCTCSKKAKVSGERKKT